MFVIYALQGCPYSIRAVDIAKKLNLKTEVVWTTHAEKNKYKRLNNMNTFPQIYYKDSPSARTRTKIGGCDEFERMLHCCQQLKQINQQLKSFGATQKMVCELCGIC